MSRCHFARASLRIVLLTANPLLAEGMRSLSGCDLTTVSDPRMVALGGQRGLLLIDPQSASPEQRVRILGLARRVSASRGWRGVFLSDMRHEHHLHLSRLAGLPVCDLRQPVAALQHEIMMMQGTRQAPRRDSVAGLTARQWEALSTSLDEALVRRGGWSATFYSHRLSALHRIRVRHMHDLRRIIAGCPG